MRNKNCDSCMMPLEKDPGPHESDRYCSYCFRGGKFTYEGNDRREFERRTYEGMVRGGKGKIMSWILSKMVRFAPRWKK